MIAAPPDITSGIITTENGRFVLTGNPTERDIDTFNKWRDEIEREEHEADAVPA